MLSIIQGATGIAHNHTGKVVVADGLIGVALLVLGA